MLAGLDGAHRPLGVQAVGQWNVDGVDRRVGEQLLVRSIGAWNAGVLREEPGLGPIPAGDRGHLYRVRSGNTCNEGARNVGCAEDADSNTRSGAFLHANAVA